MKIKELIDIGAKELRDIARRPKLEAEILLAESLKKERTWLHMYYHDPVDDASLYMRMLALRKNHIPVEYIIKKAGFYSEEFIVEEGVLIPRPETELLVDAAGREIETGGYKSLVEVGTGSGVIAVVLAQKHPELHITATDINEKAIALARRNAEKFGVADRITFVHTSYLDGLEDSFDMLVSNPPYIANDYPLETHVLAEPATALFGGEKGDEMIKKLIDIALETDIAAVAIEMGYDQRASMQEYCTAKGIENVDFYTDLAGLDRGFVARIKGTK